MSMIFIPVKPVSKKNNKRWTGKYLISSKLVLENEKKSKVYFEDANLKKEFQNKLIGLEPPYILVFGFVVDSKRARDFNNFTQGPLDLLTKYGWITDDNMFVQFPIPGVLPTGELGVKIDKHNTGVYIDVMDKKHFLTLWQ